MGDSRSDGVRSRLATPEQLDSYRLAHEQVRAFATPGLFNGADSHARVYFALFDGTGNDATREPGQLTNVGLLARQVDQLGMLDARIGAYYKAGPGTQGGLVGMLDKVNGGSFTDRVEAMYDKFSIQAARWLKDDPQANISVIVVGFSRGAEQAAAFSRLVDARGAAPPTARMVDTFLGQSTVYYNAPPLRAPGSIAQALGLYDPVGHGEPRRHDRRPPPSVLSGLQIIAADEFRALFPVTNIIGKGQSADGRFLGVSTAGAHSDIGGGFLLHGLGHRNYNLMADYLNGMLGEPMIEALPVPTAPEMSVVHDAPWYYNKLEGRKVIFSLEPTGKKKVEALNPVFAPLYKTPSSKHAGPSPMAAVLSIENTDTAAFDSIGRHQEIARVVQDAAARLHDGEVAPFALRDTNGNDVGRFEIMTLSQRNAAAPLPAGGVLVELDLGKPAFAADPARQIARSLEAVGDALERRAANADFAVLADDGKLLGKVSMAALQPEPQSARLALDADLSLA